MNYDTLEDGMLAVMRLGGDADTTMVVYGQLAGAYHGLGAIPKSGDKICIWEMRLFN